MTPLLLSAALSLNACIASVHDGDTLRLCSGERVRLIAIDAPELPGSPACWREKRAAHWCDDPARARQAQGTLARLLRSGPVTIERHGLDHYNRTLARVTVGGRDVGTVLLSLGLARRW